MWRVWSVSVVLNDSFRMNKSHKNHVKNELFLVPIFSIKNMLFSFSIFSKGYKWTNKNVYFVLFF